MDDEVARLRALCERAALPACEAEYDEDTGVWAVQPLPREQGVVVAVLAWSGIEPFGGGAVTEARAKLYAEAPAAILGLCDKLEARDRELAAVTAERDALRAERQRHASGTEDTVRLLLPHTLAQARREGAEAMREAVLREVSDDGWGDDIADPDRDNDIQRAVRALPLPGDATPADEVTP